MRAGRFVTRALAIGFFLAKAGLTFLVGWIVLRVALRPADARRRWFGRCVVQLFRDLGATFIKVGQILSTRPDLLPPHVIAALETLQDNVGPFPYRRVRQTLERELGQPPEALFASFDEQPVASASVAQVHRAALKDGRVVAVKVRRPRIEGLVEFDLRVMHAFARLLELVPSLKLLAPVESVDEFGRGIRMQLDFTIEAANNRKFRHNFAGDPDVVFPVLVEELCTREVLVMDFIAGTKVMNYRGDKAASKRLASVGFRVLLKMIFVDGFVHADLHPGNILITADHKVALLDLGLVGELDDAHRAGFARYFAAWAQADGRTMARLMAEMSPSRGRVPDYAAFEKDVVEFVGRYCGKKLGEVEVSVVFFDMMNIIRRHRVRANPTFTLVNIAIAVTEGIGKQLDPEVDLMAEALPFFARYNFFAGGANPPASTGDHAA